MANTKNNVYPSFKNKSIFKFMDIIEREKIIENYKMT